MLLTLATALAAAPWLDCDQPERPLLATDLEILDRAALPVTTRATPLPGVIPPVVFVSRQGLPAFPKGPVAVQVDPLRQGEALIELFDALRTARSEPLWVHAVEGLSPTACPDRRTTLPADAIALIPSDEAGPRTVIGSSTRWRDLHPVPAELTFDPDVVIPVPDVPPGVIPLPERSQTLPLNSSTRCAIQLATDQVGAPTAFEVEGACSAHRAYIEEQLRAKPLPAGVSGFSTVVVRGPLHADPARAAAPPTPSRRLEVLNRTRPVHPGSESAGVRCRATIWVDIEGAPEEVVVEDCPSALHASVRSALMQWRWRPAQLHGKNVPARTLVVIQFEPPAPGTPPPAPSVLPAPAPFAVPQPTVPGAEVPVSIDFDDLFPGLGAPAPVDPARYATPEVDPSALRVQNRVFPEYLQDVPLAKQGSCMVDVWVASDGRAEEAAVQACPSYFQTRAHKALLQWRWAPPMVDGVNQAVRTSIRVRYTVQDRP